MPSFVKFIGKIIFLLLLVAHFTLIILIFAPVSKLITLVNKELEMVDLSSIPQSLVKLENEKDLVPTSNLNYSNVIGRLNVRILKWRRDRFMSTEEKLAFDLTTLDFGENVVGLKAASDYYFKKPLSEISDEEWITLVNLNRIFLN